MIWLWTIILRIFGWVIIIIIIIIDMHVIVIVSAMQLARVMHDQDRVATRPIVIDTHVTHVWDDDGMQDPHRVLP